jgi:hypothetical protein
MFRRLWMALTVCGALSVAALGFAGKAEAHCGYGGYYAAYPAFYGPTYATYYAGYPAAVYPAPYPYVVYPRYHHHYHPGVVVAFGY